MLMKPFFHIYRDFNLYALFIYFQVTLHSWSSMRDRFLKILEPQMAEAGNTKKQQNNDNGNQQLENVDGFKL